MLKRTNTVQLKIVLILYELYLIVDSKSSKTNKFRDLCGNHRVFLKICKIYCHKVTGVYVVPRVDVCKNVRSDSKLNKRTCRVFIFKTTVLAFIQTVAKLHVV